MKFLATMALAVGVAGAAHAAPISGFTGNGGLVDNGGGVYTFVFDTITNPPGDIDGNADGIIFEDNTISPVSVTATSAQGTVRQDFPGNGGLGVLGSTGTDNLEVGLGETLLLTFSQSVDIVNWTFNGLLSGNGHQAAADGEFQTLSGSTTLGGDASAFDREGSDSLDGTSACALVKDFCSTTSLLFRQSSSGLPKFKGYLESVTFAFTDPTGGIPPVPLPAPLLLMATGIAGFGALRRVKRKG